MTYAIPYMTHQRLEDVSKHLKVVRVLNDLPSIMRQVLCGVVLSSLDLQPMRMFVDGCIFPLVISL